MTADNSIIQLHPALRLHAVVKSFGAVSAVDGLSLTLARGEVYTLLGPNGAGKTTTLNLILRIHPAGCRRD